MLAPRPAPKYLALYSALAAFTPTDMRMPSEDEVVPSPKSAPVELRAQSYPDRPETPVGSPHGYANPPTRRAGGSYRGRIVPSWSAPDSYPSPSTRQRGPV